MKTEKSKSEKAVRRDRRSRNADPPPPPYTSSDSNNQAGPSHHALHAREAAVTVESPNRLPQASVSSNPAPSLGTGQGHAPSSTSESASGPSSSTATSPSSNPSLNIVILAIGARGDVQPYVALALQLILSEGHRVRIATHAEFAELVTEASVRLAGLTDSKGVPLTGHLEHFNIGGDPRPVSAYLTPNASDPSQTSSGKSRRSKRTVCREMLMGCYRACFMPNESTGVPFAANAIISAPAAVGGIHIAEALGLPLSMSYVIPWTPTTAFPQPLVEVAVCQGREAQVNFSSYFTADSLLHQGLGDVINDFRLVALGLPALDLARIPEATKVLGLPWTYAWSQALVPKPEDWSDSIDVVGFFQLPPSSRAPRIPDELFEFLENGEPPIYIGFGSVVVDDPQALTDTIMAAVKETGVRAIIHANWLDSGPEKARMSGPVCFTSGDLPHDWLFAEGRVSAVCHHGGAGTTAAGLRAGRPTIVIPFHGDQFFWGDAVCAAGAGPRPIPYRELTASRLAVAFRVAQMPQIRAGAAKLGQKLSAENGAANSVRSFQSHLPVDNMMCQVDPTQVARWWCPEFAVRVSNVVAATIVESKFMSWRGFTPYRPVEYNTGGYQRPADSMSSGSFGTPAMGLRGATYGPAKEFGNSLLDIPKASFGLLGQIQEGFDNVPAYLGGSVRRRGKVDGVRSGMAEGAKGLVWGLADGLSGLFLEPVQGARDHGVAGAIGGTVTGSINLAARVTGGALGIVTQPATGLFRSARRQLARHGAVEARSVLCDAREYAAHAEALTLSSGERKEILARWETVTGSYAVKQRMKEEKERLAALQRHFSSGGRQSRTSVSSAAPSTMGASSSASRGTEVGGHAPVARTSGANAGPPAPATRSSYADSQDDRISIPGAYHSGPYSAEPEEMIQTRADSRISLNSGMDIALAGTTDRWYGSTSTLDTFPTRRGTGSFSVRSGEAVSPVSPEVRGRRLRTVRDTENSTDSRAS